MKTLNKIISMRRLYSHVPSQRTYRARTAVPSQSPVGLIDWKAVITFVGKTRVKTPMNFIDDAGGAYIECVNPLAS